MTDDPAAKRKCDAEQLPPNQEPASQPPKWRSEWKEPKKKRRNSAAPDRPTDPKTEEDVLADQLAQDTGLPHKLCKSAVLSGMEARSGWTLAVAAMRLHTEFAMNDIELASRLAMRDPRGAPGPDNLHPSLKMEATTKEFKDQLNAYLRVRDAASKALTCASRAAHTAVVFRILDNQQQGVARTRMLGPYKAGESGAAVGDVGRTFDYGDEGYEGEHEGDEDGPIDGDDVALEVDCGGAPRATAGDVLERAAELEVEQSQPGGPREFHAKEGPWWERFQEDGAKRAAEGVERLRQVDAAVTTGGADGAAAPATPSDTA